MKITLSLVILSLIFPAPLFADEVKNNGCDMAINCTIQTGNTTTTTDTISRPESSNREGSGVTTTTTTTVTEGMSSGANLEDLAGAYEKAMAAQQAAMASAAIGAAFAAMGLPQCGQPGGAAGCMLGVAGLGLLGIGLSTAAGAQIPMDQIYGGDSGSSTTTTDTGSTVDQAKLDELKAGYAKAGYTVNGDGSISLPNGKTLSGGMTSESLQAAGYSKSEAGQIMNGMRDMQAKIDQKTKDMLAAESAKKKDAEGAVSGNVNGGLLTASAAGGASEKAGLDRNPAAWTGYNKQFGDSSIGVSQADIFMMIENRVAVERKAMGH